VSQSERKGRAKIWAKRHITGAGGGKKKQIVTLSEKKQKAEGRKGADLLQKGMN